MSEQFQFAARTRDARTFPETQKTEKNSFGERFQQIQRSRSDSRLRNQERSADKNVAASKRSVESKEKKLKSLTEKDLKELAKTFDALWHESLEETDLTTLLGMLDDEQLSKLLELMDQDFSETAILFTEMLALFQNHEVIGEKPEIEALEKLLMLFSEKLENLTISVESEEINSGVKDFLQSLSDQINTIQDQLASENTDKAKLLSLLNDKGIKKEDAKDSSESKEKGKEGSFALEKGKEATIQQVVSNEQGMRPDKGSDNTKGEEGRLNMAEKITVTSDVKLDPEVIMPFQEIEALLEKNLQLVEEMKTERSELHQQVVEDMVANISMIHEKGESRVHMQLIPEHLGKLIIQLTNQDGNMTARIFAETSYARDMIENNFDQLKESLTAKGVNITQLEVYVGKDPEAYEKQREFQHQMNKGKRKKASIQDNESVGQTLGRINSSVIASNPYLSVEGFDQLG